MSQPNIENFSCPLPILHHDTVQLAHGAGGRLSADLIEKVFMPCFENATLSQLEDQAVFALERGRVALSTDSFVVDPIFFPGGDIGDLAVNGTVNDISMSGAVPQYLSVGFILEEGLPIADLHRIVVSMRRALDRAGVQIVTGDTKVVNKGSCDKIFINTSGVGVIAPELQINARQIRPGDKIILSGSIGDHGMAILTQREGLSFQSSISSDTAALNGLVQTMLRAAAGVHAMRDPTRGGLATSLNEMAKSAGLGVHIFEREIPVKDNVRGACEILGIDPLYVANEGKLVAFVAAGDAEKVLQAMQAHEFGREARIIGQATEENAGRVVLQNTLGVDRIIDVPVGEQLPRIC